MKPRFRAYRRADREGMYYCKDSLTGERESLETKDPAEAERIVIHKNETANNPQINHKIGMSYLSASDPEYKTRTWGFVMDDIMKDKKKATLTRYRTARKDKAFKKIVNKLLVETLPHHLNAVLRAGGTSTNVFLRRYQNHAFEMDWIPKRILPKKKFPKIVHKEARGITWEEHCLIIANEPNPERRDYYDFIWYSGASQSDAAMVDNADIDRERRCFVYERLKSSSLAGMEIGPKLWAVIERRPKSGPLFPYLCTVREADRATEFGQRCDRLGIEGVTLHSYRYGWAERAADVGYPERFASRALGHPCHPRRSRSEASGVSLRTFPGRVRVGGRRNL